MPGRIISLQRQARELGRLRTGLFDTSGAKGRPARSDTWIVTSHAEHYIQAAAEAWGGEVEQWEPQGGGAAQWRVVTEQAALDAILPPGDPLSQSLEMWSKGGCARRCDGVTEMLSDTPCLCRAKFGTDFHEQPTGTVCAATTRLNVFLPEMPDVGVWRMETKSHYAAMEIAGAVDLIKSAAGEESVIPIRLRIEQRMRKAEGKTKKFPVIVVELRGITTGQVLEGSVMGAVTAPKREAIEAAPPRAIEAAEVKVDADSMRNYLLTIDNLDDLGAAWVDAQKAGLTEEARDVLRGFLSSAATLDELKTMWQASVAMGLKAEAVARAGELKRAPVEIPEGASADQLWSQVIQTVPAEWSTSRVEKEFQDFTGVAVEDADVEEMRAFLAHLGEAA